MTVKNGNCGGQKNQTSYLTLDDNLSLNGDQPSRWVHRISGTLPTLAGSSNPHTYLNGKTIESLCYDWQGLLDIETALNYGVKGYSPDHTYALTLYYMPHGYSHEEMVNDLLDILNRR